MDLIKKYFGKNAEAEDLYRSIFWQVAFLSLFGAIMLFSTTYTTSILGHSSPLSLFIKGMIWVLLGWVVFSIASRVIPSQIGSWTVPLLLLSILSLLVVLIPGLGRSVLGARRWIPLGPFQFQPSELVKLALALFAAKVLSSKRRSFAFRESTLPVLIILGVIVILVMAEPDMGTTMVVALIAFGSLALAGVPKKQLFVIALLGSLAGIYFAFGKSYRAQRLMSFLHPWSHRTGASYQEVQSLAAFASGHIFGTGLGAGQAIWGYLPNASSDFIFAVVAQQLGLIGSLVLILQMVLLVITLVRIASRAAVSFDGIFVGSVACWIGGQALLNIGAVEGILPVTGVPLPLISSGGSSTIVVMCALGLVRATLRNSKVEFAVLNSDSKQANYRLASSRLRAVGPFDHVFSGLVSSLRDRKAKSSRVQSSLGKGKRSNKLIGRLGDLRVKHYDNSGGRRARLQETSRSRERSTTGGSR